MLSVATEAFQKGQVEDSSLPIPIRDPRSIHLQKTVQSYFTIKGHGSGSLLGSLFFIRQTVSETQASSDLLYLRPASDLLALYT